MSLCTNKLRIMVQSILLESFTSVLWVRFFKNHSSVKHSAVFKEWPRYVHSCIETMHQNDAYSEIRMRRSNRIAINKSRLLKQQQLNIPEQCDDPCRCDDDAWYLIYQISKWCASSNSSSRSKQVTTLSQHTNWLVQADTLGASYATVCVRGSATSIRAEHNEDAHGSVIKAWLRKLVDKPIFEEIPPLASQFIFNWTKWSRGTMAQNSEIAGSALIGRVDRDLLRIWVYELQSLSSSSLTSSIKTLPMNLPQKLSVC